MPTTQTSRMSTDAKIGRRTQSAASHCMSGYSTRAPSRTSGPGCEDDALARLRTPLSTATMSPFVSPSRTSRS